MVLYIIYISMAHKFISLSWTSSMNSSLGYPTFYSTSPCGCFIEISDLTCSKQVPEPLLCKATSLTAFPYQEMASPFFYLSQVNLGLIPEFSFFHTLSPPSIYLKIWQLLEHPISPLLVPPLAVPFPLFLLVGQFFCDHLI